MIKADARIKGLCNKEMREASEERAGWNLENNEYTKHNIGRPYDSLFCKVYFALPESQRGMLVNAQPLPPKKWNDCEWGLFYRGLVLDTFNPYYEAPNDKDKYDGLYCPLLQDGRFDLRYGGVYVSHSGIVHYFSCLEAGMRWFARNSFDDFFNTSGWLFRCNEDLFLILEDEPEQCEVEGHGLCYMVEASDNTRFNSYFIYWEVSDDENAATICDWQHPFKVVKEDGILEYLFVEGHNDKNPERTLSEPMLFYIFGEHTKHANSRELERAGKMRQWFI